MYLAKTSQICSLRQHNLDVNGRKILQEQENIYLNIYTYLYLLLPMHIIQITMLFGIHAFNLKGN